jgi:CheY-like chemotaxis protein
VNSNVLIIDDDEGTRSTYRAILRLDGYDVTTAANGGQGLEILKARTMEFDLVMADLRLPDMSGLEVLAEVRDEWPDLPIVLMSAWATAAIERAALRLGSAAVVHKPIWAEDLPVLVGRTIKRRPFMPPVVAAAGYAASRWLSVVMPLVRNRLDVPTINDWARVVGKSTTTLKNCCTAVGVTAGNSLDFGRALRIVTLYAGRRCDWYAALAIAEPRTLAHFLARAGIGQTDAVPQLNRYLDAQHFISVPDLVASVGASIELLH